MPSSPVHSEDKNKFQLKILQFDSKISACNRFFPSLGSQGGNTHGYNMSQVESVSQIVYLKTNSSTILVTQGKSSVMVFFGFRFMLPQNSFIIRRPSGAKDAFQDSISTQRQVCKFIHSSADV